MIIPKLNGDSISCLCEIPSLLSTGCVSCLEHDEHYILTFPNGYGRQVELVHSSAVQAVGPAIL